MKKTIVAIMSMLILVSCKEEKSAVSQAGQSVIIGVYKKKGSTKVGEVLQIIQDGVLTDSVTNKKTIVTDTIYGTWELFTDSLGRPEKRLQGKDSVVGTWMMISKDSVDINIQNVPISTLLKRFN